MSPIRLVFWTTFGDFWWLQNLNIFWKMCDFNNFVPTNHSPNNRQFSEFLVKLSGFLLTKKWFHLLKMLHFFREPETPSDSGITSRRRWSHFPASFGKTIPKYDTFCWFYWQKTWRIFFENNNFSFEKMVQILRKTTILKGFQKVNPILCETYYFSKKI